MKELYHEEQKILSDYVGKVKNKDLNMDDAVGIAVHYKDLLDQSKVITRISDRLQKKLDHANQKIKSQNSEIQKNNVELENTIGQLDKMTVGKKATRLMFLIFVILFISEQLWIEPIIEESIDIPYVGIGIMLLLALTLKFLESNLEQYFLKKIKNKIIGNSGSGNSNLNSQNNFSKSKRMA